MKKIAQKQKNLTEEAHELYKQASSYPFYLRITSVEDLLKSLKIEVPALIRLPFSTLDATLTLEPSQKAILKLTFSDSSGTPPPMLAVRLALNFALSQFPKTVLALAWKRTLITTDPLNPSRVTATLSLTQKELQTSLATMVKTYQKAHHEAKISSNALRR